jgi:hypothetical protein
MRRTIIHSIHLLAAFLLMVTVSGCVEPISPDQPVAPGARTLTLQIALPSATSLLTKADPDPSTIVGPNDERKVTSLQIWAFKHGAAGTATALAYLPFSPDNPLENPMTVSMTLPDAVMDEVSLDDDTPLTLDFYVLANGSTFNLKGDSTLESVCNAVITGFGSGASMVTSVPTAGLPMSVSQENFDVTFLLMSLTSEQISYIEGEWKAEHELPLSNPVKEGKPVFSDAQWNYLKTKLFSDDKWDYSKVCVVLKMTRAVSKIRFVFAKATSMTVTTATGVKPVNTEIISIKLIDSLANATSSTKMLPKGTYLFPRETGNVVHSAGTGTEEDYEAFSWTGDNASLVPSSSFDGKTVDSPLRLRWDEYQKTHTPATLSGYTDFLDDEIGQNHAIDKVLYLRESDKKDKKHNYCRIQYKIGDGQAQSIDIALPTGTLSRNTWWTVYTYFMSYELGFEVTVSPWNGVESHGQLEDPDLNL